MLKLVKPDKKYYNQYKEMMDEWNMEGSRIAPWSLSLKYHTQGCFYEMLARVEEVEQVEQGENLGEYAASTTYWLYDEETNKLLGASNLRHYLTEKGLNLWGHIGYGIRPSERKKGYATELLRLTLQKAKEKNINRVLLAAYVGNIGSWKTMEKCGGKLENVVVEEETGLPVKKYWISLKKRFADSPKKRANVLAVEQKMLKIHENDFCGDIFLNDFRKVENPTLLENGLCLIDTNYKWLQFYDYGSKVCLTTIYNEKNEIVEWYFDIAREIGKENGVPYEDDLYLDVVLKPNGETVLLDEDELKEAFERMEMTKKEFDEAYEVAKNLMKKLQGNQDKVKNFTDKYLQKMLKVKLYKFCEYQDEDFEKLQCIKKDCFKWYVEKIYGWDDKKQIEFSQNFIEEHKKDIKVIVYAHQKIGVFTNYINENNESVISLFYIDKKYQNRGIGTNILEEQLKKDEVNRRSTILQVFKENKARFLYEKMGFEIYDETETHYKMRRNLKE